MPFRWQLHEYQFPYVRIVKTYADNKLGMFTAADVIANCPGGGRTSVFSALKKLTEEEYIEKHGERQSAFYVKKSTGLW